MSEFATYKNRHTGKVAKYLRRESVPNHPDPITVHILLIDGKENMLDSESFLGHWRRLDLHPKSHSRKDDRT